MVLETAKTAVVVGVWTYTQNVRTSPLQKCHKIRGVSLKISEMVEQEKLHILSSLNVKTQTYLIDTRIMANIKYFPNNGTTSEVGGIISTTSRKNTWRLINMEMDSVTWNKIAPFYHYWSVTTTFNHVWRFSITKKNVDIEKSGKFLRTI